MYFADNHGYPGDLGEEGGPRLTGVKDDYQILGLVLLVR